MCERKKVVWGNFLIYESILAIVFSFDDRWMRRMSILGNWILVSAQFVWQYFEMKKTGEHGLCQNWHGFDTVNPPSSDFGRGLRQANLQWLEILRYLQDRLLPPVLEHDQMMGDDGQHPVHCQQNSWQASFCIRTMAGWWSDYAVMPHACRPPSN